MGATVPCKGCQNRNVSCHTTCVAYINWSEKRRKAKHEADKHRKYSALEEARTTHVPFINRKR